MNNLLPNNLARRCNGILRWLFVGYPAWVYVMSAVTLAFLAVTLVVSYFSGMPLRDPEGSLFGKRILLPAFLMVVFFAADMVHRGRRIWTTSELSPAEALRKVFFDRWWPGRLRIAFVGFWTFHLTYLSYRNLKSWLPIVFPDQTHDKWLTHTDEWMMFGRAPATLLQDLFGRDIAAHVLSTIYLAFIPFVPISIAIALMFSERIRNGYYFVSAAVFNWILGTASYYLIPSLGPFAVSQYQFENLPATGVTRVQDLLINSRLELRGDALGGGDIQSIAAFASLHVSIVLTAMLVCWQLRMRNWTIFFGVALVPTIISTVYFGWHYILDDLAGVVIAVMAITFAKWVVFPGSQVRDRIPTKSSANIQQSQSIPESV